MPQERDFERAWLGKLSHGVEEIMGREIRMAVMEDSETLSSRSGRQEVIAWSKQAMNRLDALVDAGNKRAIMTGCACQYPRSDLQAMRTAYDDLPNLLLLRGWFLQGHLGRDSAGAC